MKLILPEDSVSDCQAYLADKGINAQHIYPDIDEIPRRIEKIAFELPGVEAGSDLENLFKAVGFVVVQWGNAEQTLDLLAVGVFSCFAGHELLKRRPKQLGQKIEFLRKCFATFPKLSPFKAECDDLLNRFESLSQSRHDIVHGAIDSISAENDVFTFTKIDVNPREHHELRTVLLDNAEWSEYLRALMKLGTDDISLARKVWDALKVRR